jgi:hypothetical protein
MVIEQNKQPKRHSIKKLKDDFNTKRTKMALNSNHTAHHITPQATTTATPRRVVPKGIKDGFEISEETLKLLDLTERVVADHLIEEGFWKLKKSKTN